MTKSQAKRLTDKIRAKVESIPMTKSPDDSYSRLRRSVILDVVDIFCEAAKNDIPNFNRLNFLEDCGLGDLANV